MSADLYTANGDFTVWLYGERVPNHTVELTAGVDEFGNFHCFVFPDDETQVRAAFEDNLEFALPLDRRRDW